MTQGMTTAGKAVRIIIRKILYSLCRVDAEAVKSVPTEGPLIVITNHINFLEVPVLRIELFPRNAVGLVKKEAWNSFWFTWLARMWRGIPIHRNEVDRVAFEQMENVLKQREILCIAPEGTRSGHGRLLKGQPGVISIAARHNVPILPVVHYGGEMFWKNLKGIRKTRMTFKRGRMFRLKTGEKRLTRTLREEMLREVMFQMALALPEKYRGFYSDISLATTHHLEFLE